MQTLLHRNKILELFSCKHCKHFNKVIQDRCEDCNKRIEPRYINYTILLFFKVSCLNKQGRTDYKIYTKYFIINVITLIISMLVIALQLTLSITGMISV